MEAAVVLLSVALVALSVLCASLASTIPWLWWRTFRAEARMRAQSKRVAVIEETLKQLLESIGVPPAEERR